MYLHVGVQLWPCVDHESRTQLPRRYATGSEADVPGRVLVPLPLRRLDARAGLEPAAGEVVAAGWTRHRLGEPVRTTGRAAGSMDPRVALGARGAARCGAD